MSKKCFVITDGKRFVKQDASGKHKLVSNQSLADFWDSKPKAESVLYNSVPPYMRYSLYVAELNDNILCQETISQKQIVKCRENVAVQDSDSYELSKYSFDEDEAVQDMIRGFHEVKEVLKKYSNNHKHKELEEEVMRMNLIVEDIKHYHGRKALNSRDGFKLNKLEDKAIIKRISVKNQLEIAREINKCSAIIMEHISVICDVIDTVRNQRYKPRVLVDLFENNNLDVEF